MGGDDEDTPEKTFAKKAFFPSSMGLSLLVNENTNYLNATIAWGDYAPYKDNSDEIEAPAQEEPTMSACWKRSPHEVELVIPLQSDNNTELKYSYNLTIAVPDSNGLQLVVSIRPVPSKELVPLGTLSVSVFLVNNRLPTSDKERDITYTFQTSLAINTSEALVPRPNLRGRDNHDWDESVADLQYRDDYEYAVGHNVSAVAITNPDGSCNHIHTAWIPTADVEKVIATEEEFKDVELGMEEIAASNTPLTLQNMLISMVDIYGDWIEQQRVKLPQEAKRLSIASDLLQRATLAKNRIKEGIQALQDPLIFEAFQIGNRAIATYIRQRATHGKDITPESIEPPKWRPFQLAFILMNLVGVADPENEDRELVDLPFFPTGGGKTEAYLGLAAFTLVLRRLHNPDIKSAGLSVLMRYTLRLLTLDQLGRAAAMICALELERQKNPEKLGTWPFEIGLWVGQAATPNRMGKSNDGDDYSAYRRTINFQKNDRNPSPIPLENCPWCGTKFSRNSFNLVKRDQPIDLNICCSNRRCNFSGSKNKHLPIVAVDEPLYRRLPCFIIATVDKFASLPWVGETGASINI